MKFLALFFLLGTAAFAAERSIDGVYLPWGMGASGAYVVEWFEVKNGRFTYRMVTDASPPVTETGSYRRIGDCLLMLADSQDWAEAYYPVIYDDVSFLVHGRDYRNFLKGPSTAYTMFVRMAPEQANEEGWKRLLDEHPKLKAAMRGQ